MTEPTKIDPKLAAATERLRSGASSLTSESATLGITYNQLQGRLKRELGTAGYKSLMTANHKPARQKPKAPKVRAARKKTTKAKAK
jgi:hypothetical protein